MNVDLEMIRRRMLAFWEHECIDRACVSVSAPLEPGANISMFHNDRRDMENDPEALRRYWEDPATIRQNTVNRINRTWMGGETLPVLFQNYGTSGHCRFYGAKPVYGNDTLWFPQAWEEINPSPVFDETELARELAITEYLCRHAGDDYLVGMPDSGGTLDALVHLCGAENLMLDLVDSPEEVEQAACIIDDGWRVSNERFHQAALPVNGGGVHAWMHLWAPGRIAQMQCDFSVMVSPSLYERFALPELLRQSEWADFPVYHFDGVAQERHLDYILSVPRLRAVQWTEVAGEPSPRHWLPILQRIQRAGKSLIVMCPPEDMRPLLEGLSCKGLYLHTTAQTPEDGQEILRLVEKYSKE